jgi:hypothetical protein
MNKDNLIQLINEKFHNFGLIQQYTIPDVVKHIQKDGKYHYDEVKNGGIITIVNDGRYGNCCFYDNSRFSYAFENESAIRFITKKLPQFIKDRYGSTNDNHRLINHLDDFSEIANRYISYGRTFTIRCVLDVCNMEINGDISDVPIKFEYIKEWTK